MSFGEDMEPPRRQKFLELHACLASTGEYLTMVRISRDASVADLCQAVAEQAPIAKREPCTFRAFIRGRFWEGCQRLANTGLDSKSTVELVRCQPLSVLITAEDGTAKVFNAETGMCSVTIFSPRSDPAGLCSPDAARVVEFTSSSNVAHIRSVTSNETLALSGHDGPIKAAVFSIEGYHVGTASADGTAIIWNARTGEKLQRLVGHAGEVSSIAFAPDGHHVATASTDGTVKVWAVASGQSTVTLCGHKWSVTSVNFSPDGVWVITGSEDRSARLWHVETATCAREFEGHKSPVVDVLISDCWDTESAAQLLL